MASQLALALGPILELVLQDQDPPLLLGDLVNLATKLLIKGFQGLLDVGRMQHERGHGAQRPEERHLFVFVRHAAALGAQHQQAGEVPLGSERGGCFASERDHRVGSGVARAVERHRVREPHGGDRPKASHEWILRREGRLFRRRPVGRHELKYSARRIAKVKRSPLEPQHLRRGLEQPPAERHPVDQATDGEVHLLHCPVELVLLTEELAVDHPLKPAARQLRENQHHEHRNRRGERYPGRRMAREKLVADQFAADQQHARIDQPRGETEGEIDRAAIDEVFGLHQLVSRDAEGIRDRVEQRHAEHRPGRVSAPERGRVDAGLHQQVGDQHRGDQRRPHDPAHLVALAAGLRVAVAENHAVDTDPEQEDRQTDVSLRQ